MIYGSLQENPHFHGGHAGYTPLMLACADIDLETVIRLLKDGFDVDARNQFMQTALHLAADCAWKNVQEGQKVVEILIEAGADINVQMDNGVTPLMIAGCRKTIEIVRLLLENGADPNLRRDNGSTVLGFIDKAPSVKKGAKRVVKLLEEFGGTR